MLVEDNTYIICTKLLWEKEKIVVQALANQKYWNHNFDGSIGNEKSL
jgi:hypothetical protein